MMEVMELGRGANQASTIIYSEVLSGLQGHGGDSRCWHGLKGAILLLHVPSGVSLPLAFTARFTLEVVVTGPGIH